MPSPTKIFCINPTAIIQELSASLSAPLRKSSLVEIDSSEFDFKTIAEAAAADGQTIQQFMRAASADFAASRPRKK